MKLKVLTEYLKDGILGCYNQINLKCGCLCYNFFARVSGGFWSKIVALSDQ